MNEVSGIIQNINGSSLVILDELGSDTNIEEGIGISWAIVELLIQKKCFVLLATHIFYLTHLASLYPQVNK